MTKRTETWSCGTNSHLPFDVNVMLNLSIDTVSRKKIILHDVTAAIFVYKTMNRQPCLCTKKILWELYSFHMLKLTFIPSNLPSYWPRDWKRSNLLRLFIIRTNRVKGVVFMFFIYIYINWQITKSCSITWCTSLLEGQCDILRIFLKIL